MGMNVGGNSRSVKADINITPLVDVVLVLLIIFMVLVPIMMRQVVLDVPRKLNENEVVSADTKSLTVLVKNDLSIVFNDGDKETTMAAIDLATTLKPLLAAKKTEKVVFVDFEDGVPWRDVISVMDTVRGLAIAQTQKGTTDWDEIKVALKLRETPPAPM